MDYIERKLWAKIYASEFARLAAMWEDSVRAGDGKAKKEEHVLDGDLCTLWAQRRADQAVSLLQERTHMLLDVIVSGQKRVLAAQPHRKVGDLVKKALIASGLREESTEGWVLYDENNELLEHGMTLGDYNIVDKQRLYLNPKPPHGG